MLASVRDVPYFREENRLDIKIAYIHDFSPHNLKKFPQTPANFHAHTRFYTKSAGAEAAAARVVAAYEREDSSDHIARGKRRRAQHSTLATADYARHSSAFSVPRSILHKNIFVYLT